MSKITLWGYIDIPPEDLPAVKEELAHHITLSRNEIGCLCFEIAQDANMATRFHVYEEFHSKQALAQHQARVKTSTWGKITARAKRHYNELEAGENKL